MVIKVDDVELMTVTAHQKNVLEYVMPAAAVEDFLKERLQWIATEKLSCRYKGLRNYWEPILIAEEVESLPTDPDAFATLVFAHDDYKDRATRDAEEQS